MGRTKKDKGATPPKKVPKKRAEAKPPPEEDTEGATVCKDFVTLRWETTEEGQLAVWQPADGDEPSTLTTLPGSIVSVKFDKHCAVVYESEGNRKGTKKTVWYT